ncbi:hypothetical protein [Pseudomonas amygdali]|uniref:hypothetical protein n=1 Tax=Pseudomonas amygdali TaxID=47877 RepID=UPI001FB58D17|nr:hypothetical protein [Pseudomonas amygdali]UPT35714.1 hypothetical protein LT107_20155 [Pseudomonas amygdali pv. loropetali]
MRNLTNITTIDLHVDTQKSTHNGIRTSLYLQSRLKANAPENLLVRYAHRKFHDVGAWCFLGEKTLRLPKKVDITLHRPERAFPIQNLVSEIITMACTDKTAKGAGSKLTDFSSLVNFCGTGRHVSFLSSAEEYQEALEAYTEHLKVSKLAIPTKARMQSVAVECGSYLFPTSGLDFSLGLERLRGTLYKSSPTSPPPNGQIERFVGVFGTVFSELADFALKCRKFPCIVKIDGERALLSTEAYLILSASQALTKVRNVQMSPFVDYTTGKCKPLAQALQENLATRTDSYDKFCKHQVRRVETGNTDAYSLPRRRVQKLAHDSFVALFTINTGANESSIIEAPWDPKYTVTKGDKGARIITLKHRGGTHSVQFTVTAPFIKTFQKYVMLRHHILNGENHDRLFLGFSYRKFSGFRQLDDDIITRLCQQMRAMVDPQFPIVSYRRLRAYKDSWTTANYDTSTSAALLQHSDKVQRNNYTNVEEREAIDSIVGALSKIVCKFKTPKDISIPLGSCSGAKPGNTGKIPLGYTPDCTNSRGCLFCTEFRTTAEPESIHKLYSMEFTIKKLLNTCTDLEQFNLIHQPAVDRIGELLKEIHEINPDLITDSSRIREDVYIKHNLTEYWEKFLSRLIRIGAIS